MSELAEFRATYDRHKYATLFYSLLLSIVVLPVLSQFHLSMRVITAFFTINLLTAVIPIASRRLRLGLLVIMLLAALEHFFPVLFTHPQLRIYSMGVLSLIALLAASQALRFSLGAKKISGEQLYAALGAYLLAGIFLGNIYFMLEKVSPGSLLMNGQVPADFRLSHGVYFSFITLATLGYGDIVPTSELARGVAIVEAVAGQLYLAVMVARLVSLYVAHKE